MRGAVIRPFAESGENLIKGFLQQIEHFVHFRARHDEGRGKDHGCAKRPADQAIFKRLVGDAFGYADLAVERGLAIFVCDDFDGSHEADPAYLAGMRMVAEALEPVLKMRRKRADIVDQPLILDHVERFQRHRAAKRVARGREAVGEFAKALRSLHQFV